MPCVRPREPLFAVEGAVFDVLALDLAALAALADHLLVGSLFEMFCIAEPRVRECGALRPWCALTPETASISHRSNVEF